MFIEEIQINSMTVKSNIEYLKSFFESNLNFQGKKKLLKELNESDFAKAEMKKIWDEIEDHIDSIEQEKIFENINRKINFKKSFDIKIPNGIAAAILLCFMASISVYLVLNKRNDKKTRALADTEIIVNRWQMVQLKLPDGSRVWMNSESVLINTFY